MTKPVHIISHASVAGCEEQNGPLGKYFDICGSGDDTFGCKTWEKAESEMQRLALGRALSASLVSEGELNMIFAGDLLNQCVGSSFGLLDFDAPFLGLYGACSTAAEGLLLSAVACCSCGVCRCGAAASSHNASAERQFRFPLEYGGQRAPTSQWTVTGAGAFIVSSEAGDIERLPAKNQPLPKIAQVLPGRMVDGGITDANNMGAAMAPAAADTLYRFFTESETCPQDYDLILTGDLGQEGSAILIDLLKAQDCDISANHSDCGLLIYNSAIQDKHAGGSGCGCSAAVLSAHTLRLMGEGAYKNVLFLGTGALMSPLSIQQGNPIIGIGHLINITAGCVH